jgi:uncharacterized RDD family membrane protein YckC
MSDRPNDPGLTSGDPLGSEPDEPRQEQAPPRSEPETPPQDAGRPSQEQAPPKSTPDTFPGGYSSPPPPGAVGAPVQTAPAVSSYGRYTLAGWWSRVGAALIDGLIIGVGALLIVALFGSVFSIGFFASEETGVVSLVVGLMLSFLAIAIISLLYAPLMMARTNGKTLGRMAMGIRVVRANGEVMTFGWAMLREVAVKALLFGMILSSITMGLAWLIDVLWPLWDDENRALHDFIVDTRVVRD